MKKFLMLLLSLHFGLMLAFAGQSFVGKTVGSYPPENGKTFAKKWAAAPIPSPKKQQEGKVVVIVFTVVAIVGLAWLIYYIISAFNNPLYLLLGDLPFGLSIGLGAVAFLGGIITHFKLKKRENKKFAKLALIPTWIGGFLAGLGVILLLYTIFAIIYYIVSWFL